MYWHFKLVSCGVWRWSTGDIGNGWDAVVEDSSQADEEVTQPTYYRAYAQSQRLRIIADPDQCILAFDLAKSSALTIALAQEEEKA